MNKVLDILTIIAVLLVVIMISTFGYMIIRLYRFNQCYNNNFEMNYCEKYKDF